LTAVDRDLTDTTLAARLHDQAYTGGLQLQHRWDANRWELDVLQGYAQPFVAAGAYDELKDVDAPRARRFEDRFTLVGSAASIGLDNPDFDVRELRSTLVMRWEYRPGSTLFAIWSHGQTSDDMGMFDLGSDLAALAHSPSEDIVMVKATYWLGL
jgi:hypothetical protein